MRRRNFATIRAFGAPDGLTLTGASGRHLLTVKVASNRLGAFSLQMDPNAELRILLKARDENPFAAVSLHLVAKRQHFVLPVWNQGIDVPHDPAVEGIGVIRLKAIVAILVPDRALECACRLFRLAIHWTRIGGAFVASGALEGVGCESLGCHDDATDCILPKRIVAAAIVIFGIDAA